LNRLVSIQGEERSITNAFRVFVVEEAIFTGVEN